MAWKTRLRGDNPKFIDIMEEGAADSSGAIARVPLRDGFYNYATRNADLIAKAPAMQAEIEALRRERNDLLEALEDCADKLAIECIGFHREDLTMVMYRTTKAIARARGAG